MLQNSQPIKPVSSIPRTFTGAEFRPMVASSPRRPLPAFLRARHFPKARGVLLRSNGAFCLNGLSHF
jgi:hypothetical protein